MYYIYLYSESNYKKSGSQYGYWTGKSYIVQGEEYPVCENEISKYKRKGYKSLKRAISGGEIAELKYGYVCGFDIEDESGTVIYELHRSSYRNSKQLDQPVRNSTMHEIYKETKTRERIIQVAVKYIEKVPEELSDMEIDEYLNNKYPDKEFRWCDNDQDVFEEL